MSHEIVPAIPRQLAQAGFDLLPRAVTSAGEKATRRFIQFFVANIRNKNTRLAYARAIYQFFDWCEARGLELQHIEPELLSIYRASPGGKAHDQATPRCHPHAF